LRRGRDTLIEGAIAVSFDPQRFEAFLARDAQFRTRMGLAMSKNASSFTLVDYEDVPSLRGPISVADALGLTPLETGSLHPAFIKQTTEPLHCLVKNYEEMKSYLISRHGNLLDDRGAPELL
jgi:hypothetical protein